MDVMIGQKSNLELILNWRFNKSIPRFILIQGNIGSGRFTLAKQICSVLNTVPIVCDSGKDDIRDVIQNSYLIYDFQCYIFRDIDTMSDGAKNALLKIVEEPPNNCYFIMTVEDFDNVPATIISRAFTMTMNPYTEAELRNFTANENLIKYCSTPGQILYWEDKDFDEFITFCRNATETIFNGTGIKALQITNSLKSKAEDDGYDPALFVGIISKMILQKIETTVKSQDCLRLISRTSNLQRLLRIKSIKKDSLIDDYILWVRDFLDETVS